MNHFAMWKLLDTFWGNLIGKETALFSLPTYYWLEDYLPLEVQVQVYEKWDDGFELFGSEEFDDMDLALAEHLKAE